MVKRTISVFALVIVCVAAYLMFGLYRVRGIDLFPDNFTALYSKADEQFCETKGDVYLTSGEMIMQANAPVAQGALDACLGNMMGYSGDYTNETVMNSVLAYTNGAMRPKKGSRFDGYDVYLTVSGSLQPYLANLLAGTTGQAVAINYKTGAIVACVSQGKNVSLSECFEASTYGVDADGNWSYDAKTANSVTQTGIYPGSTIKPIIACAVMEIEGSQELLDYTHTCNAGSELLDEKNDYWLQCYGGASHGENVSARQALTKSCNKFLASYVLSKSDLKEKMDDKMAAFGFVGYGKKMNPTNMHDNVFTLENEKSLDYALIGQGDTKFSLVSLAAFYGAMANGGKLVPPHFIKAYSEIGAKDELVTLEYEANEIMSAKTAEAVTNILRNTVLLGTGKAIGEQIDRDFHLSVKTGTTDQADGTTNKLCAAYSNTDEYPYVVVIEIPKAQGDACELMKKVWQYFE